MFRSLIALVTALAAGATSLLGTAAQAQERDVKFVLDFISLGRHAPWYVALGKGYFKDEGLNVTIMPSKGTADAIRTVATGGAELGFIDIPSLVASGSAGSAVKIVAANYQKPPYCIFTLESGRQRHRAEADGGPRARLQHGVVRAEDLGRLHGNEQGRQQDAQGREYRCRLPRAHARGRQGAVDRSVPDERARHPPRGDDRETGMPVRRRLSVSRSTPTRSASPRTSWPRTPRS